MPPPAQHQSEPHENAVTWFPCRGLLDFTAIISALFKTGTFPIQLDHSRILRQHKSCDTTTSYTSIILCPPRNSVDQSNITHSSNSRSNTKSGKAVKKSTMIETACWILSSAVVVVAAATTAVDTIRQRYLLPDC